MIKNSFLTGESWPSTATRIKRRNQPPSVTHHRDADEFICNLLGLEFEFTHMFCHQAGDTFPSTDAVVVDGPARYRSSAIEGVPPTALHPYEVRFHQPEEVEPDFVARPSLLAILRIVRIDTRLQDSVDEVVAKRDASASITLTVGDGGNPKVFFCEAGAARLSAATHQAMPEAA